MRAIWRHWREGTSSHRLPARSAALRAGGRPRSRQKSGRGRSLRRAARSRQAGGCLRPLCKRRGPGRWTTAFSPARCRGQAANTRGNTSSSIVPVRSSTVVKAISVLDLVVITLFLTTVQRIVTNLVVQVAGLLFVRKARQRGGGDPGDQRAVSVQRVAGQVQARDLLLHLEQFGGRDTPAGPGPGNPRPSARRPRRTARQKGRAGLPGSGARRSRRFSGSAPRSAACRGGWVPGRRTRRRGSGFPARGG